MNAKQIDRLLSSIDQVCIHLVVVREGALHALR